MGQALLILQERASPDFWGRKNTQQKRVAYPGRLVVEPWDGAAVKLGKGKGKRGRNERKDGGKFEIAVK